MPSIVFKYVPIAGRFYPAIPITLTYGARKITTLALVDSGATVSVFRSEVAESLELPWEEGERVVITSANASFNAYLHSLEAVIGQLVFVLKLGFTDSLTTSFNILGRESFLETFDITISEKNRTIVLERTTASGRSYRSLA